MVITHREAETRDHRKHDKQFDRDTRQWSCTCYDRWGIGSKWARSECEHRTGQWPLINPRAGRFERKRKRATSEDRHGEKAGERDGVQVSGRAPATTEGGQRPQSSFGDSLTTDEGVSEVDVEESREGAQSFRDFVADPQPDGTPPIVSAHLRHQAAHNSRVNAQPEPVQKHECPCHNVDVCVSMLREAVRKAGVEGPDLVRYYGDMAENARITRRPPRMTMKVLEGLFPESERLDDYDLLCHRIIQDEDQSVHEASPYAFLLNGWPRETGDYYFRINKLAKEEDMDVVEEKVDMLLGLWGKKVHDSVRTVHKINTTFSVPSDAIVIVIDD